MYVTKPLPAEAMNLWISGSFEECGLAVGRLWTASQASKSSALILIPLLSMNFP